MTSKLFCHRFIVHLGNLKQYQFISNTLSRFIKKKKKKRKKKLKQTKTKKTKTIYTHVSTEKFQYRVNVVILNAGKRL